MKLLGFDYLLKLKTLKYQINLRVLVTLSLVI